MSDLTTNSNGKIEICECSFTYNRRKHLITAGRRSGTQFVFKPHVFANLFEVIKHKPTEPQESGYRND